MNTYDIGKDLDYVKRNTPFLDRCSTLEPATIHLVILGETYEENGLELFVGTLEELLQQTRKERFSEAVKKFNTIEYFDIDSDSDGLQARKANLWRRFRRDCEDRLLPVWVTSKVVHALKTL